MPKNGMTVGRLARTVSRLHPLQIVARAPHAAVARAARHVPSSGAPSVLGGWPETPVALRTLANAERTRGAGRLTRLPAGSRLRAYEATYGLELGADDGAPPGDWTGATAMEAYPASVRARRLAVATRCGRAGLGPELARAARAAWLQPEVHLLGNHLLENGFGLVCAGAAARGPEADAWWTAGRALLAWQLPEQFLADGAHVERSASYHAALVTALLEATELAEASGRGAPEAWRQTAQRALGWLAAVRAPDGSFPLFNDAALDASPELDAVLALGRALALEPTPSDLRATGWVRLEVDGACLLVDAGPDAEGWQPGHAHADGLGFELWVEGERVVVDYGIASYAPGPEREATRATRSHSTVEIDGCDSCEVWGAFRVGRRGTGRVLGREHDPQRERVDLDHDGYAWLPGSPRHVRALEVAPHLLRVTDHVAGGRLPWVSRLRLAAPSPARVSGSGDVVRSDDRWHLRHGDPLPALVLEQRPSAADGCVEWRIEW